jgi:3-(3-hydroxy-phenyl)propionate hydroxylase
MGIGVEVPKAMAGHGVAVKGLSLPPTPELASRYVGGVERAVYLLRPDQHVAARWDHLDEAAVATAVARAIGKE